MTDGAVTGGGADDSRVEALADAVAGELPEGEILQLVGPSGTGLSRLGTRLRARPPAGWGPVGLVEQDAHLHVTGLRATVAEELAFPLEQRGVRHPEMEARVSGLLAEEGLGLAGLSERDPARLSGGQTRRLAVGCVLATEPDVLVLDDSFAGLDPRARERLAGLCRSFADRGGRVLVLGTAPVAEIRGARALSPSDEGDGRVGLVPFTEPGPVELPGRVGPAGAGAEGGCGAVVAGACGTDAPGELRSGTDGSDGSGTAGAHCSGTAGAHCSGTAGAHGSDTVAEIRGLVARPGYAPEPKGRLRRVLGRLFSRKSKAARVAGAHTHR